MDLNIPSQNHFSFELLNSLLLVGSTVISSLSNPHLKCVWLEPHTFGITGKSNPDCWQLQDACFKLQSKTLTCFQSCCESVDLPQLRWGTARKGGLGKPLVHPSLSTPGWVSTHTHTYTHTHTHTHTQENANSRWSKAIPPFSSLGGSNRTILLPRSKMGSQRPPGKQANFMNNYLP